MPEQTASLFFQKICTWSAKKQYLCKFFDYDEKSCQIFQKQSDKRFHEKEKSVRVAGCHRMSGGRTLG